MPITKAFVKYARSSGIKVYSDSDTGNDKNVVTGIAWANRLDVDVFISIHCDWYKVASGTLPLYCKGSTNGKRLAICLNTYVKKYTGIRTRGVTARTDLGELNQTNMPACIFETGSIKADRYEWDTAVECDEYGKALAMGLCKYFGIPFKEPEEETILFRCKVTAKSLNRRKGPGTNYAKNGSLKKGVICSIVKTKTVKNVKWGKLKNGTGWVCLKYTKKIK